MYVRCLGGDAFKVTAAYLERIQILCVCPQGLQLDRTINRLKSSGPVRTGLVIHLQAQCTTELEAAAKKNASRGGPAKLLRHPMGLSGAASRHNTLVYPSLSITGATSWYTTTARFIGWLCVNDGSCQMTPDMSADLCVLHLHAGVPGPLCVSPVANCNKRASESQTVQLQACYIAWLFLQLLKSHVLSMPCKATLAAELDLTVQRSTRTVSLRISSGMRGFSSRECSFHLMGGPNSCSGKVLAIL